MWARDRSKHTQGYTKYIERKHIKQQKIQWNAESKHTGVSIQNWEKEARVDRGSGVHKKWETKF